MDEETKLRASLAGARLARDEAQEERDRMRTRVLELEGQAGDRERQLRDALKDMRAERDRLRAVVDAVRVMWDNIVGTADEAAYDADLEIDESDDYDQMDRDELLARVRDWRQVANDRTSEIARLQEQREWVDAALHEVVTQRDRLQASIAKATNG